MDKNQLYQLYLQELARQQAEQRRGSGNPLDKLRGYTQKVGSWGNKFSTAGNTIKDNINNEVAQKIGTSLSNIGGTVQNGANSALNVLDKPTNYFKGFAGQGLQNLGTKLGTQSGVLGTLGNGMTSIGSTLAGTTAGTAGGAAAGGAAAGAGGAAAGGAAAGGAAAGGGAASGALAAGPIGALAALAIMAIQGTNRKRAKKSGQALLEETDKLAAQENEEADPMERAELAKQNAAALQSQAQNALQNGTITGGAAQVQQTPIEEYQDYLRRIGYSDDIINGVSQGLNGGNQDIADWINQYNAGAGRNNPINIPQTDEEIAAAKAGTFNNNYQTGNVQQTDQIKQGLFDKFVSGISDLTRGYEENRNNAFKPNNLQDKSFTTEDGQKIDKGGMARLGEAAGTIGRFVTKPGVQALLAGGLSTALTGNPMYGLGMAAKYGGNRAMSNIYQNALAKQGIQADPGMFGTLSSSDMNALMTPQYKEQENEILKERLGEQQRYHDLMMQYYQDKLKETHENNVRNQEIKDYKAKNGTKVTHISTGGSGRNNSGGKNNTNKGVDLKAIEELQKRGYKLINGVWTK